MRLDLGGGLAPAPGHINIDLIDQADIKYNLEFGLPLDFIGSSKGLVEGVRCHQLLEHLDDIILLMNNTFDVMKPGALFEISTPYALSEQCWTDPTHKRGYTKDTFQYFIKESPFQKEKDEYGITTDFELVRCELVDGWNLEVIFKKPE